VEKLIPNHENSLINKNRNKDSSNTLINSNGSKSINNKRAATKHEFNFNYTQTTNNEKRNKIFLSQNFLTINCNLQKEQLIKKYLDIKDLEKVINKTNYYENLLFLQITNLLIISRCNSESAKLIIKTFLNSYFLNTVREYLKKMNKDIELFNILKCEKKFNFFNFLTETNEFFYKISNYFLSLQSKFPTSELEDLVIKLKEIFEEDQVEFIYVKNISESFEKFKNNLTPFSAPEIKINIKEALKRGFINVENVPIDYQYTSIELSTEELLEPFTKSIEVHREKGSYESWERYINTLFYLTREDCYRSLRKEIEFIFNKQPKEANSRINKLSDVYYYKKITVDSVEAGKFGVMLKIEIDLKVNRIAMLGSKRLLNGSLVIITDEAFENVSFCLVKEIDNEYFKRHKTKALVTLEFLNPTYDEINKIISVLKNKTIQMFESKAFYQAYCHILKRLKNLQIEALPFKDVIINFVKDDYNKRRIDFVPEYSREGGSLKFNSTIFYPSRSLWPPSLARNLDTSQFDALKHSLLNKVALIQGPPGTGIRKEYFAGRRQMQRRKSIANYTKKETR